ncbi:unnamed protein product [Effrenium voratum]|uniref:Uncharacterized protein n=1 Tax=Effrenium voratum TaxID=2562239 RepID=A0AA36JEW0_9DINO|nr:unnamed protein product [Effrenium voratum]CAJ1461717.1 unnamed protein product [Effrenium voratum]
MTQQFQGRSLPMSFPSKDRHERRVLGDLSNTSWPGNAEKRERHEPPRTPRKRSVEDFEVFTGGENDTMGQEGGDATSERERMRDLLRDLGVQELPALDRCAEAPSATFWKPFWEGGPADPAELVEGLGNAMDYADLEAQRFDLEAWTATPRKDEDDLSLPLPSPPSISPFRMDLDEPMERPSPRRLA